MNQNFLILLNKNVLILLDQNMLILLVSNIYMIVVLKHFDTKNYAWRLQKLLQSIVHFSCMLFCTKTCFNTPKLYTTLIKSQIDLLLACTLFWLKQYLEINGIIDSVSHNARLGFEFKITLINGWSPIILTFLTQAVKCSLFKTIKSLKFLSCSNSSILLIAVQYLCDSF